MIAQRQFSVKIPQQVNSPEIALLLYCARSAVNQDGVDKIKALIELELNWNYLLSTAVTHGVMPLLAYNLTNLCPEVIPQDILFQLQNYLQSNAFNNLGLNHQLIKILQFLELHKIPAIPFKGIVLATSVYRNPLLRKISDLDILVHSWDFSKTKELLIAQGYKIHKDLSWECHLIKDNGVTIDLHKEIIPKHLSCSLGSNYIWEHLESFNLSGTTVTKLTPEACLLMLCLNGTKECWRSLSRICDVAELIHAHPYINWQQVMEQAEKMGFKRLIFLGLYLARNLLGASFPDSIWQQVQSDKVVYSLALQVYEKLFLSTWKSCGTVETTFFHIKIRERWQDKAQSFFGLMLLSGWLHPTSRERDVIPFPTLLYFLYYLIRPIRVFRKYINVLFD